LTVGEQLLQLLVLQIVVNYFCAWTHGNFFAR
jgi:hypothetical protein